MTDELQINADRDYVSFARHAISRFLGSGHVIAYRQLWVLLKNLPACEDKFAQMAIAMGEDKTAYTQGELAQRAIWRVKSLYIDLGFPSKLDEEEVSPKEIPEMVKRAMTWPQIKFNIRRSTEQDLTRIYEKAFQGWEL